jgi:hypothetical protein
MKVREYFKQQKRQKMPEGNKFEVFQKIMNETQRQQ